MATHELFINFGYEYCMMLINNNISYQINDDNYEYPVDLKELEILCKGWTYL